MTYKEKHQYYNIRFRDLSFIVYKKAISTNLVSERDIKLAKNIFSEMMNDHEITLSEEALTYIKQLDTLPNIGVSINEMLLFITIDGVLRGMCLTKDYNFCVEFDGRIGTYGGACMDLPLSMRGDI